MNEHGPGIADRIHTDHRLMSIIAMGLLLSQINDSLISAAPESKPGILFQEKRSIHNTSA
jgi:DNA-binding PucR family transcriptional regulator